jgi:hypothetical protein
VSLDLVVLGRLVHLLGMGLDFGVLVLALLVRHFSSSGILRAVMALLSHKTDPGIEIFQWRRLLPTLPADCPLR